VRIKHNRYPELRGVPLRRIIWVRLKNHWRSAVNYRHGYVYGPVQRFRCCGHTTPFHSARCGDHG
jgi:hypothetical protein